jgi:hypothetical protein
MTNDQRENHRRDREEERIASLPLEEQDAAIEAEALKQIEYDNKQAQAAAREHETRVDDDS